MRTVIALLLALTLAVQPAHAAKHPIRHWMGTIRVTQYLWTSNRTASGYWPFVGECAADPSIPFGSRVTVPGLGTYIVLDRGSAVYGAHIDLFVWRLNYSIHDYYAGAYWWQ